MLSAMRYTGHTDELTERVDAEVRAVVNERRFPLYDLMGYHLGWGGAPGVDEVVSVRHRQDWTHGVLSLLACEAMGGDADACLPAAAALELVDKFAQIHDDVQEGSPQRNGRDAVWWVWGPAQAINTGDGMHALARLALLRLSERGVDDVLVFEVVRLVDAASLRTFEGKFRDLEAQERIDISVSAYMDIAAAKSGALMGCAMQIGALIGGASAETAALMAACGEKLGTALQVRWDIAALWGEHGKDGAQPNVEVLNKKKLIPVVYALENASISEKRAMGEIYFKRVLDADDAVRLRDVIEGLGARAACEQMADGLLADALAAIEGVGAGEDGMQALTDYLKSLGGAL